MDVTVITTYRCDSKCSMCYAWQHPSHPREEVSVASLARLPEGIDYLNLTGGEPTLRGDLLELAAILRPKTKTLEISTNGMHWERLVPIVQRYPDVKIRFSLDGIGMTNDRIRGEQGGFERKVEGLKKLKNAGARDLGFGATIQDENAAQLVRLFQLCAEIGVEFATSTLHNAYQFFKNDNGFYDSAAVAAHVKNLMAAQLRTWDVKTWFRAYLNSGLIARIQGRRRLLPCGAGRDFVFIDPWADVYACNVRPDLKMGNLRTQTLAEVLDGPLGAVKRGLAAGCGQNCWMVGSAKAAMRTRRWARVPRLEPLLWVIRNKCRVAIGRDLCVDERVAPKPGRTRGGAPERVSFLGKSAPRRILRENESRYTHPGGYVNQ